MNLLAIIDYYAIGENQVKFSETGPNPSDSKHRLSERTQRWGKFLNCWCQNCMTVNSRKDGHSVIKCPKTKVAVLIGQPFSAERNNHAKEGYQFILLLACLEILKSREILKPK